MIELTGLGVHRCMEQAWHDVAYLFDTTRSAVKVSPVTSLTPVTRSEGALLVLPLLVLLLGVSAGSCSVMMVSTLHPVRILTP